MADKPPLRAVDEPLPPYSMGELREDLHHLIQPIIGALRIEGVRPNDVDRLYLALALADVASGQRPINDIDVRMARTRHGCGYFRNEEGAVRDKIRAVKLAERASTDNAQTRQHHALCVSVCPPDCPCWCHMERPDL